MNDPVVRAFPMRIHLDTVGGLAGDMFVAAVIDAMPHMAEGLLATLNTLSLPPGICVALTDTRDDGLKGLRFVVAGVAQESHRHSPEAVVSDHEHDQDHEYRQTQVQMSMIADEHHHRSYNDIRRWLSASCLKESVKAHVLELFSVLAQAEAHVHGTDIESVEFHEVGAWDSIIDFVAASWIIDTLSPCRWSWSPLPIGSGFVKCAHGVLPVPAPATARLLTGMRVTNDGIRGERVTPTGAAILKHLCDLGATVDPAAASQEVLAGTGIGHGTRRLPGIPNIVRCILFEDQQEVLSGAPEIACLQFEVDDQSPEDLAVALDHIRTTAGVLEIYQAPLFGKKGRVAVQVQILLDVSAIETVFAECFVETTTLGIRVSHVMRRTLQRREVRLDDESALRVKLAQRPRGETTAKAEMSDLAHLRGHALREQVRADAQQRAINQESI